MVCLLVSVLLVLLVWYFLDVVLLFSCLLSCVVSVVVFLFGLLVCCLAGVCLCSLVWCW